MTALAASSPVKPRQGPQRIPLEVGTESNESRSVEAFRVILLADLEARNAEIRERLSQESSGYLAYLTSFISAVVAIAAADAFGKGLTALFREYLPIALLVLAIVLLWPPINELNQQLRLRTLALYIERHLRPAIRTTFYDQGRSADILAWESYQARELLTLTKTAWLSLPVFLFRGFLVPYAPASAVLIYFFLSGPFSAGVPIVVEVVLLCLCGLVAMIPCVGAVYLALAPTLNITRPHAVSE